MRRILFIVALLSLALGVTAHSQTVPNSPKDLSDALKAIRSADPVERAAGFSFVALLGPDAKIATREVVNALYDGNKDVRYWAGRALPLVDPQIAKPVFTLVNSNDADARQQAMLQLSEMKTGAAPAIPALLKSFQNAEGEAKANIIATLASVGAKDASLSSMLANLALKDPNPEVRAAAFRALPQMEDKAGAIEVVKEMLKNTDPAQRAAAVTGLGVFAKGNAQAMQALQASLNDPSPTVREAAKAALARLKAQN